MRSLLLLLLPILASAAVTSLMSASFYPTTIKKVIPSNTNWMKGSKETLSDGTPVQEGDFVADNTLAVSNDNQVLKVSIQPGAETARIAAGGFNMNLPENAVVHGFQLHMKRLGSQLDMPMDTFIGLHSDMMALVNLCPNGCQWMSGTEDMYMFGNPTHMNLEQNASVFNSASFSVAFSVMNPSSTSVVMAMIDSVSIYIEYYLRNAETTTGYTPPATTSTGTTGGSTVPSTTGVQPVATTGVQFVKPTNASIGCVGSFHFSQTEFIALPAPSTLDYLGSSSFTVASWFKVDQIDATPRILVAKGQAVAGWNITVQVVNGTNTVAFSGKTQNGANSATIYAKIALNEWFHLTVSYNAMVLNVYLNGKLVNTKTFTASQTYSNGQPSVTYFGRASNDYTATAILSAEMAEFVAFRGAPTKSQILSIYAGQALKIGTMHNGLASGSRLWLVYAVGANAFVNVESQYYADTGLPNVTFYNDTYTFSLSNSLPATTNIKCGKASLNANNFERVSTFPNVRTLTAQCAASGSAVVYSPTPIAKKGTNAVTWADVSNQTGSKHLHQFDHMMNMAFTGADVAAGDYNNDGLIDLYVTHSIPGNVLYKNMGDGTFQEVSVQAGVHMPARTSMGIGMLMSDAAAFADYNNDGCLDLYVTSFHGDGNVLYRSNCDGTFTDVTIATKAWPTIDGATGRARDPAHYRGTGVTWHDIDKDGCLDLMLSYHMDETDFNSWYNKEGAFDMIRKFDVLRSRMCDAVPVNEFEDWSTKFGDYGNSRNYKEYAASYLTMAADFLGKDKVEVYYSVDSSIATFGQYQKNGQLYSYNPATTNYTKVSTGNQGLSITNVYAMGAAFGDVQNDGLPDLYLSSICSTPLFIGREDGTFMNLSPHSETDGHTMYDPKTGRKINCALLSAWGVGMFDYDNDGWTDIYKANGDMGMIGNPNMGVTGGVVLPGLGATTGGEHHDDHGMMMNMTMDMEFHPHEINMSQYIEEPNNFYRNLGNGKFEDIAAITGTNDAAITHGLALIDYNNDGFLDMYTANLGGYTKLYENPGKADHHSIQIKLVGTESNSDGFGATITIAAGGNAQYKQHTGRVASHMSSQNIPLHFGLATSTVVDWICVAWPSGRVQTLYNVPADTIVVMTEPCSTDKSVMGTCPFFTGSPRSFTTATMASRCNVIDSNNQYCDPSATCNYNANSMVTTCTCPPGTTPVGATNGVIFNTGLKTACQPIGCGGKSASLTATSYITANAAANQLSSAQWSVGGWFKVNSLDATPRAILSKPSGATTTGWKLHVQNMGTNATIGFTGTAGARSIGPMYSAIPTGQWFFVYVTYGAGNLNMYINSKLVAQSTGAANAFSTDTSNALLIGREFTNGNGAVIDVNVATLIGYSTVTTQANIDLIYAGYPASAATAGRLFLYYINDNNNYFTVAVAGTTTAITTSTFTTVTSVPYVIAARCGASNPSGFTTSNQFPNLRTSRTTCAASGSAVAFQSPAVTPTGSAIWEDIAAETGTRHLHLFDHMMNMAMTGADVAAGDYNNDGFVDLYVTNGGPGNKLYKNMGDGTFTEVSESAGVHMPARSEEGIMMLMSDAAAWADYNNDGCLDLYVTTFHGDGNVLYRSNCDGTFTDVTIATKAYPFYTGIPGIQREAMNYRGTGVTWHDIDKDGCLDLMLSYHMDEMDFNAWYNMEGAFDMIRKFDVLRSRMCDAVPVNEFEDWSTKFGDYGDARNYKEYAASYLTMAADFRGKGEVEVYFSTDSSIATFGRYQKNGHLYAYDAATKNYTEVNTGNNGLAIRNVFAMGAAFGDIQNDGLPDLYLSSICAAPLFVGRADGTYTNLASNAEVDGHYMMNSKDDWRTKLNCALISSWGVGMFDYDNDGWSDIYKVNGDMGMIGNPNMGVTGGVVLPGLGQTTGTGEMHHMPMMNMSMGMEFMFEILNMTTYYKQPNNFYRNLGNGRFEDVAIQTGTDDSWVGHGLALLDYNNDGAMDMYVVNLGGYSKFLQNPGNLGRHWLQIKLVGTKSNFDGFGATITISAGGNAQYKQHTGRVASHMSSQNIPLHFGLADSEVVDWICVAWPSGQVQTITSVPADRIVVMTEPCVTPIVPGKCPFVAGPRSYTIHKLLNRCLTIDSKNAYCDPLADCSYSEATTVTTCSCPAPLQGNGIHPQLNGQGCKPAA